jgi:hypothetical protein
MPSPAKIISVRIPIDLLHRCHDFVAAREVNDDIKFTNMSELIVIALEEKLAKRERSRRRSRPAAETPTFICPPSDDPDSGIDLSEGLNPNMEIE